MYKTFYILSLCAAALCAWSGMAGAAESIRAGDYLAGQFAQARHDWQRASRFMHQLIDENKAPDSVLQRVMVLSMGSGDAGKAIKLAGRLKDKYPDAPNIMADLILIADAFKKNDYKAAAAVLDSLPADGTITFIRPFIESWLHAAQDTLHIDNLGHNTAQLYHAILISDFLNDHKKIEKMIGRALQTKDITPQDMERIADIYGHVRLKDKALGLYRAALEHTPGNTVLKDKIADLQRGTNKPLFKKVKTAQHGMAKAFDDIAAILYDEGSDESARVFAHIALHLEPGMAQTIFLLADISRDHEQYDNAIALYNSIKAPEKDYIAAQHKIVEVHEDTGRIKEALALLKRLSRKHRNIETHIKIGNLHRAQDDFTAALRAYDEAVRALGGNGYARLLAYPLYARHCL